MASAWPTPPPSPDPTDTDVAARSESPERRDDPTRYHPNTSQLVDELRATATDDQQSMETLLSAVTMAAFDLTEATGAALALRTQGAVICLARAGDTAPPLGVTLDTDSGISGECLRTGVAQRCTDVMSDPRVDVEASRCLSVRSLAAVPLRDSAGVIGILEVFSDHSDAFSDDHINLLNQLAEIVVSRRSQEAEPDISIPEDQGQVEAATGSSVSSAVLRTAIIKRLGGTLRRNRPLGIAASAIAILAVLIPVGRLVSRTYHRAAQGPLVSSPEVVSAGSSPADAARSFAPVPAKSAARSEIVANDVVVRASKAATLTRNLPVPAVKSGKAPLRTSENATSVADELNPPEVSQMLGDLQNSSVRVPSAIVTPPVQMPLGTLQVSQGVTGGTLTYSVSPIYPDQARFQRIEGAVVLQAIVGEDGNLHDVEVVSGNPMLASAAKHAVAKWRYASYHLNGMPVSMRTNITIQFKLPK